MHLDAVDERGGPGLEVDGLPYPARVPVALLPFQLERPRHVVHPQDQRLVGARRRVRQFHLERRVTALVASERPAVEPHVGLPVGCADHEEHALALPLRRHPDRPRVPGNLRLVCDTGQLRPPRVGDVDGQRERAGSALEPALPLTGVGGIEAEAPVAVQVDPLGAFEIGPRVLGQRNLRPRQSRQRHQDGQQQPRQSHSFLQPGCTLRRGSPRRQRLASARGDRVGVRC